MKQQWTLYRFELKKILCRKITVISLMAVLVVMCAMNAGEYIVGSRLVNHADRPLAGRVLDDTLLEEMRDAIELVTTEQTIGDKTQTVAIGVSIKDPTYVNLFDWLYQVMGSYDKAYSVDAQKLNEAFSKIINERYRELKLTDREIAYWNAKREQVQAPLVYQPKGAYQDALTIMYATNMLILLAVATTLSGVFADETILKTDALLFASAIGKSKLCSIKLAAGFTIGLLETVLVTLVNLLTQFAISGGDGYHASIQFAEGPCAYPLDVGTGLCISIGIMLVIGILYSAIVMAVSLLSRSATVPIATMIMLIFASLVNIKGSRIFRQLFDYMPATFLGSWTFTDYRLIFLFGHPLNLLQSAPLVYALLCVALCALVRVFYCRYQVTGR